ncbi:unnamed protein product, partial [marine sediment metagenome]
SNESEPSLWEKLRAELEAAEEARRQRERRTRTARRKLKADLKRFSDTVDSDEIRDAVDSVVSDLRDRAQKLQGTDPGEALASLNNMEIGAERALRSLRQSLHIEKPAELGLTREESRDWAAYETGIAELDQDIFSRAEVSIADVIRNRAGELELAFNAKERARTLAAEAMSDARGRIRAETEGVSDQVERIERAVEGILSEVSSTLESEEEKLSSKLEQQADNELKAVQLDTLRFQLTQRLLEENEKQLTVLARIRQQLEAV